MQKQGQLGIGNLHDQYLPVCISQEFFKYKNVVKITAGKRFSVFCVESFDKTHSLMACGSNELGELGDTLRDSSLNRLPRSVVMLRCKFERLRISEVISGTSATTIVYEDGAVECFGNWITIRGCKTTNYDGFDCIREPQLKAIQKLTKQISNRIGTSHFVLFEEAKKIAFCMCFHDRLGNKCNWLKELQIEIVHLIFEMIANSRMLAKPNELIAKQIGVDWKQLQNWST